MLVPGLVDLHTHLYEGVSHYGIDPDANCLRRGVTTAVDAGSSGAQTFPGFRRHVIERAQTRVLAFLHVAVQGMISTLVGELEDLRWASPAQAIARAREHPDVIVGVKVRLGYQMVGDDPGPALHLARQAAEQLGLPLMVHIIDMRRPISWLLRYLGEGDIVTHRFHANEGGILDQDGRLHPAVARARARGVLFDVGHGAGSFAYRVAKAAFAQDFPPDTVSSDLHAHNVGGPVYDQATTLSKLLHSGMSLAEVIMAATAAPAAAIGRGGEIGSLAPGSVADLTGFELRAGDGCSPTARDAARWWSAGRAAACRPGGRVHRIEPVIPGSRDGLPGSGGTLVVTGGTVVTPDGARQADVVIADGTVIAVTGRAGAAGRGRRAARRQRLLRAAGRGGPALPHHGRRGRGDQGGGPGRHDHRLVVHQPRAGRGRGQRACCAAATNSRRRARGGRRAARDALPPGPRGPGGLRALREAGAAGVKVFLAYPELGIMWSAGGLSGLMTAAARLARGPGPLRGRPVIAGWPPRRSRPGAPGRACSRRPGRRRPRRRRWPSC